MSSTFKPMLSGTMKDTSLIKFPVIASPKLDGIRIVVHDKLGPVTRSLKSIPNTYVRNTINSLDLAYLDGELVVGDVASPIAFNRTQSAVMSSLGSPDFTFVVFDSFEHPDKPYTERFAEAAAKVAIANVIAPDIKIVLIENMDISSLDDLSYYEMDCLVQNYEGVMIRQPDGPYKFGRSTERAGTLVKLKQYSDDEAVVVGVEYLQRNNNVATTNALGRTERSSHKGGKTTDYTEVGALIVKGITGPYEDITFKIGTGFTQEMRQNLAYEGDDLIGNIVNYIYQDEGAKDAPRFPRFNGFRDPDTMSV
jgi:DNA ligase-1